MQGCNEYRMEHILVYFQYAKKSHSHRTVTHEKLDLHKFAGKFEKSYRRCTIA